MSVGYKHCFNLLYTTLLLPVGLVYCHCCSFQDKCRTTGRRRFRCCCFSCCRCRCACAWKYINNTPPVLLFASEVMMMCHDNTLRYVCHFIYIVMITYFLISHNISHWLKSCTMQQQAYCTTVFCNNSSTWLDTHHHVQLMTFELKQHFTCCICCVFAVDLTHSLLYNKCTNWTCAVLALTFIY